MELQFIFRLANLNLSHICQGIRVESLVRPLRITVIKSVQETCAGLQLNLFSTARHPLQIAMTKVEKRADVVGSTQVLGKH
jgi:hypothetical protein